MIHKNTINNKRVLFFFRSDQVGVYSRSCFQMASTGTEIRLDETPAERAWYDSLAELYSIVVTCDLLEKAYLRDAVSADEYTQACGKLISQFELAKKMVMVPGYSFEQFLQEYSVSHHKAALDRLTIGVPATVERGHHTSAKGHNRAIDVAEVTQFFITAMDALKLDLSAVDQIQPLIKDVLEGLNKLPSLPQDFEGKVMARNWLQILNQMSAADELDDKQRRQLSFELEKSYNAFYHMLSSDH